METPDVSIRAFYIKNALSVSPCLSTYKASPPPPNIQAGRRPPHGGRVLHAPHNSLQNFATNKNMVSRPRLHRRIRHYSLAIALQLKLSEIMFFKLSQNGRGQPNLMTQQAVSHRYLDPGAL